jgi:hypothetical protein
MHPNYDDLSGPESMHHPTKIDSQNVQEERAKNNLTFEQTEILRKAISVITKSYISVTEMKIEGN